MTRKKVKIVWGKSDNDEIDIKKVAPSQLDRELEELQQEMNLAFYDMIKKELDYLRNAEKIDWGKKLFGI